MKRWMFAFGLLLMVPVTLGAQTTASSSSALSLPPDEVALAAIERMPEVQVAAADLTRAEADARLRNVGTHEATLSVSPQRRHIKGGPSFNEWEADLSRPMRWPHKARLDREIGAAGVESAQLMLADAHHAGALTLLELWSTWQRARTLAAQQSTQVTIWERDHTAIARRIDLGDAAQRDLITAEAALAQARAAVAQADSDAQTAASFLSSTFPSLPLPERISLGVEPPTLSGSDTYWTDLIVQRSHEIGAMEAMAHQYETEAQRARADRLPDPTVGVRVFDDVGGLERAVGVLVSIPFGVRQRSALAAAAAANAQAAQAELTIMRRDISRDARNSVARARAARAIWNSQHQALVAAKHSAEKTERAYTLGESGLAELLAARRVELEATLSERNAMIDAVEAVARVRIDAHDLWHEHASSEHQNEFHEPDARPGAHLPEL